MTQLRPPAPFNQRPWLDDDVVLPAQAAAIPTMLTDEEGDLLFWLTRDYVTGTGTICDLGCFAGGSTARLAAGIAASERSGKVHAFDHFTLSEAQKDRYLYPAGIAPFSGSDMLGAVSQLLAPWGGIVDLRRGDITKTKWRDGPIEVLFIDAAKTPIATDQIAKIFMPHLIPGRSIVVQQDYLHWRQPWLPAQMQLMSDSMRPVGWCRKNTVIFLVEQEVTQDRLRQSYVTDLSDTQMIDLIGRALVRFPDRPQRAHLARSILGLRDNPGARAPHKMDGERITPERVNLIIAEMEAKFGVA